MLELKIDLVLGEIPNKSRVRLLNPVQKEHLRNQIDEWLEQGVIEPSVSPWASPLVLVKKKDGQARWVTNLRELNKQTIKDSYPLTNIQTILHSLKGATVFLSLDVECINQWELSVHSIYQPLQHIPVYTNAIWISQCWECV